MRGGSKPGVKRGPGRKGVPNKATAEVKRTIEALAQEHGPAALQTLVDICTLKSNPAASRVAAATALLDRGFGKPRQSIDMKASVTASVKAMTDDELSEQIAALSDFASKIEP